MLFGAGLSGDVGQQPGPEEREAAVGKGVGVAGDIARRVPSGAVCAFCPHETPTPHRHLRPPETVVGTRWLSPGRLRWPCCHTKGTAHSPMMPGRSIKSCAAFAFVTHRGLTFLFLFLHLELEMGSRLRCSQKLPSRSPRNNCEFVLGMVCVTGWQ